MFKISRALLSVYDKTGIVDFARNLADSGVSLISTGGTAAALRDAGIPVVDVSEITGFPEIMEGRVKTLHPMIHGGLLGKLDDELHLDAMRTHGIDSIDLVVVNLYPFEQTIARTSDLGEIIEQIDIGGPAMVRAAAKNYRYTAVVTSPAEYPAIIGELRSSDLSLSEETRARLMRTAFAHTAQYDAAIARYFDERTRADAAATDGAATTRASGATASSLSAGDELAVGMKRDIAMRYGENPHQHAALYGDFGSIFEHLHGKELSYNNILDIDAAAKLVLEFTLPTLAIIKHNNPCGVASADTLLDAWNKAFATDVKSPFGGIVAVNRPLDLPAAEAINQIFTEVIIAPEYPEEVLELLRRKKDRRIVRVDFSKLAEALAQPQLRSVAGGVLVQGYDGALIGADGVSVVTRREPTGEEKAAMEFAWRVAKHVKSNAIVYASADRTLGIGAGQMSRVDSAMIAARKAAIAGLDLRGSAVASDAFFPFADGLMEAVEAGASAVIQPGGSIRDQEVIDAADANGLAMAFTGMRHFRH
jgi:phosphoribosylaminoimidazolecarboxamide formyltransferase/IMP cyclohydrolase